MDSDEFEDGFGLNSAEDNYYAILNVNKDVSVRWTDWQSHRQYFLWQICVLCSPITVKHNLERKNPNASTVTRMSCYEIRLFCFTPLGYHRRNKRSLSEIQSYVPSR